LQDLFTAPGPNVPRRNYGVLTWLGSSWLRLTGWKTEGQLPNLSQAVVAVAPHSSNWDFVHAIAFVFAAQLRVGFLGKHSLFKGALGVFMRWVGGVPVDRSKPTGVVDAITQHLNKTGSGWFAWSPEGTRTPGSSYKSGFYRVAKDANLPIMPVYFNYRTKRIGFLPPILPTLEIDAGVAQIKALLVAHGCRKDHHEQNHQ
jgi:1-acyl-sn-glycerol-3-phosphate acyltransferase